MSFFNFLKEFVLKFRQNDSTSKNVFDHYFFDLKFYLHQDTYRQEFSILLNISDEKLDQISIYYYGSPFQSLLNECRYRHLIEEIESPINSNISIESIIKLSGFSGYDNFVEFIKKKEEAAFFYNELSSNTYTKYPKSS